MPSRKVEANAKNKDRIEVFKQTYGLIRVALAYQNGQGGTAVVISCFSVCHLVVEVQFLRVRPMDGTVATGIQCQAVQMVSGFLEALEYLLPSQRLCSNCKSSEQAIWSIAARTRAQSSKDGSAKSRMTLL